MPTNRRLLILDLDETLVHVREGDPTGPCDFTFPGHHAVRRPHVDGFLEFAFSRFEVAVWSAAAVDYVEHVVQAIFPKPERLSFVWGRPRCTLRRDFQSATTYWLKDLKKVRRRGWALSDILVLDDKTESYRRNYGNLVRVSPFEGDPADRQLLDLVETLGRRAQRTDVRGPD